MKIGARDIEGFVRRPDPGIHVALFFGPDQGMVTELSRRLGANVVDDFNDPFSVVELSEADLKDDPARLGDEARAMSFGGGRRLVRVRGGGEPVSAALKVFLEAPGGGSLITIEAGELTPKAAIRVLCEKNKYCAAIGCYPDHAGDLAATIRSAFADEGLSVDRDALDLLVAQLAPDRGVVRQEIAKLGLYVGSGGQVAAEDVMACLTDAAAVSPDRIAFACGDGDTAAVDILTRRAFNEGVSEIAILRALQHHFSRLEWAVAVGGANAVGRLKPAVFFRDRDRFARQAGGWKLAAVRRALAALTDAEIGCKSTGEPSALLCSRALLAVASWAPRVSRGRGVNREQT